MEGLNFLAIIVIIILLYFSIKISLIKKEKKEKDIDNKLKWILFSIILIIGILIRFWDFPNIPIGFNQDEAAIAYDAYSILENGFDRNGYKFPVYPVSWGAGQGPFYMYFSIPFMIIFGTGIFGFRIGNVILSIISLVCMFFMLSKMFKTKYALIGMLILTISPWNIILSRWSLDANPLPSLFIIATMILVMAIENRKTIWYILASIIYAISLYTYGASYVIIPIFLALAIPYLYIQKKITLKQIIISGIAFIIVSLPLICFWIINIFDLNEITTNIFSVPKLTYIRSQSVFKTFDNGFKDLIQSILDYINLVIMQKSDGLIWNSVPGYGIYYLFTVPLLLTGILLTFSKIKFKEFNYNYIIASMFIASTILVLLIEPNINRIHLIYVPVLMLILKAIEFTGEQDNNFIYVIILLSVVFFARFSNYYINEYNNEIGTSFYESFQQAIEYAEENCIQGRIYITSSVNGNYILTLFHTKYDTKNYIESVEYYDENAEFRMAKNYGRYNFYIPSNIDYSANYIVNNSELEKFNTENFNIKMFKNYSVVYPK